MIKNSLCGDGNRKYFSKSIKANSVTGSPTKKSPFLAFLAAGGHTMWVLLGELFYLYVIKNQGSN